ncbi:glycoside hydrolase family 18 protein [Catenovulum sp. SM1970]|uniref:glycoside hydrolase family 18 protein n=1 Tax=Marinifaba aquimaris TaxID=2741323 RepID=UPI0015726994|nr:glycoside hydrolase family 18 protein [Marinifaba aquimaris]NTS77539.1 glycoside hydrolase family 18 protein [Marinifaba aquimaris]
MKKLTFLLLTLLVSSFSSWANTCKPVIAVYPVWLEDHPTAIKNLPWHQFSHIAIASIYPKEDGSLETTQADTFIKQLVKAAKAHDTQVVISVGGAHHASKGFLSIVKSEDKLATFTQSLKRYVAKYNLDGVDIDWEYWTYQSELGKGGQDPIESKQLVKLAAMVNDTLPDDILLTADIAAGPWVGPQYLAELQSHVDYLNLMAFDFTGAWSSSPIAHHSDFATFKLAINNVLNRGFTKDKLLISLPAYGIEFIDGENKQINHVSYKSIAKTLGEDEKKINQGQYGHIYFETPSLIKQKVDYALKHDLAGFSFFEINSDSNNQAISLMNQLALGVSTKSCAYSQLQPLAK